MAVVGSFSYVYLIGVVPAGLAGALYALCFDRFRASGAARRRRRLIFGALSAVLCIAALGIVMAFFAGRAGNASAQTDLFFWALLAMIPGSFAGALCALIVGMTDSERGTT